VGGVGSLGIKRGNEPINAEQKRLILVGKNPPRGSHPKVKRTVNGGGSIHMLRGGTINGRVAQGKKGWRNKLKNEFEPGLGALQKAEMGKVGTMSGGTQNGERPTSGGVKITPGSVSF